MKKMASKTFKLKLNRETLRNLEQDDLKVVEGGASIAETNCVRCEINTKPTCLC